MKPCSEIKGLGFFADSCLVSLLIVWQNIKFLLAKLAGHIRIGESSK